MRTPWLTRSSILWLLLLAALALAQSGADPWTNADLLDPAKFAATLQAGKAPTILCVAFPVLYRNRHIVHAVYAGPGYKPEGIELLKKSVAGLPKDAEIVLYCGCCPMVKCPNIRPSYRVLKEMGFTRVKVLHIPTNMHLDWYQKGYPSEPGSAS
jgi:hypothetical protein